MNTKLSDIIQIGDFMEKGYGLLDFSFMAIQIIGIPLIFIYQKFEDWIEK